MNSKVIKFVAGGGKTTESIKILANNKNGLYLAFTNSVVSDIKNKGYLSKTIDSLFEGFIIPKFTSVVPLISSGAKICYRVSDEKSFFKGIGNIKINKDGTICNKSKKTVINMKLENSDLFKMKKFTNDVFIKLIFSETSLNINDQHRAEISSYLINNYPKEIVEILRNRFSYIIIDEAQDLKDFREEFARLIFSSEINLFLLGDELQNINGGGTWFGNLDSNVVKKVSYRCPENLCKWIRDNLKIEIYGNKDFGEYIKIDYNDVLNYDNESRVLLYNSNIGKNTEIISKWKGPKDTIKKAKGRTIKEDIVIIGETLNRKNLYTAITRTKKNAFSTINKITLT